MVERIIPIRPENTQTSSAGCGTCSTKTDGNCKSHLAGAAIQIAQTFIRKGKMYDRANPDHLAFVEAALRTGLTDEKTGNPVSYELPKEDPKLYYEFITTLENSVSEGLGLQKKSSDVGNTPNETKRANPPKGEVIRIPRRYVPG